MFNFFANFLLCDFFKRNLEFVKFLFFFSSAIIIIIFARFLNSRICPPAKFAKIKTSRIWPDPHYTRFTKQPQVVGTRAGGHMSGNYRFYQVIYHVHPIRLILSQHLRRWASIEPTLFQRHIWKYHSNAANGGGNINHQYSFSGGTVFRRRNSTSICVRLFRRRNPTSVCVRFWL